jgi:hypothetical protein
MAKLHSVRRRLAARLFLLAVICLITASGNAHGQTARTAGQSNTAVAEALQIGFGALVEAMTGFKPFYVMGDFNGDGGQDIVVVVRINGRRNNLPKDVRVLNPFEFRGAIKFPANPASENKLALAIIHGWKTPGPRRTFLLIGDSPILILEYARATSNQLDDRKGLIELMGKRDKRPKGETLPRGSRGDVIVLGTEVGGDSHLYWDGRTYRWQDSAED